MQSLRRFIVLALFAAAISAGFFYGRAQGARAGARPVLHANVYAVESLPPSAQGADSSVPPSDVYDSVLDHVQHQFVEGGAACDNARLSSAALSRMLSTLDGARYLDAQSAVARRSELLGDYQGVGAAFTVVRTHRQDVEYRYLTVEDVMPGSPAQRAGLQTGDRVKSIDGHWVVAYSSRLDFDHPGRVSDPVLNPQESSAHGISLARAMQMLTCGVGVHMNISVERSGLAAPLQLTVTTAPTTVDPIDFRMVGDRVGCLRVRLFCRRGIDAVQNAVTASTGLKGLIVDLRGCPGGVQSTADADGFACVERLLNLLTRGGAVASIEHHPGQRAPLRVEGSGHTRTVIVLIDSGTANLAELAAAGLRDGAHARLIGSRTFGDDLLMMFAPLQSGAALELTTAHLYTAGGIDISHGIAPDIAIFPSANGSTDLAMARALMVLQS